MISSTSGWDNGWSDTNANKRSCYDFGEGELTYKLLPYVDDTSTAEGFALYDLEYAELPNNNGYYIRMKYHSDYWRWVNFFNAESQGRDTDYDGGFEMCEDTDTLLKYTEKLKALFAENGVDYRQGDLRSAIAAQNSAAFFAALTKCLQITLAMRYSSTEDGKDFILSPVADENGVFYCSEGREDGLPQDADANGAFNIARKGLMVLEQIDKAEKYKDWTTKISNRAWLDFVQTHGI